MTKFQITNTVSSVDLGIYKADDEAGALDQMAVAAGYKDYKALTDTCGKRRGEILVTVVKPFAEDKDAQDAIESLVVDLIDVAESAGHTPSDWNSISCDGSLNSTLRDLGGQYVAAADGDDDELLAEIIVYLDKETERQTSSKSDELASDIKNAKSLVSLRDALEAADAYAKATRTDVASIYDATDLPTFGGAAIDQELVFSWDSQDMLVGHGSWSIVGRGFDRETTHQQRTIVIGDTEYRYQDRYYFGQNHIDTIRFARWVDAEDGHAQHFHGYIDIPAFDRDVVLVSDLVVAIKQREAQLEAAE
ncbi:MAG TPA: hypothetical protein VIL88_17840 [Devosia sp.]|jgi:hypothetical protein|uniref:hypothetical protein n=1 Tax=Devosia sp. TaxID=1871048 RepID=UPI002F936001